VGIYSPVTISGYVLPDSWNWPWLIGEEQSESSSLVLTAYSWQSAKQQWQTPLDLGAGTPVFAAFENLLQVWLPAAGTITDANSPQDVIVDGQDGDVVWQGDDYKAFEAGHRVVYMSIPTGGTDGDTLYAFDLESSNFAELWSMSAPEGALQFDAMANHVIALNGETGQLWVLQPQP